LLLKTADITEHQSIPLAAMKKKVTNVPSASSTAPIQGVVSQTDKETAER